MTGTESNDTNSAIHNGYEYGCEHPKRDEVEEMNK